MNSNLLLVNLTPDGVTIISGETRTEIPPSGTVARLTARYVPDGKLGDIPVVRADYGGIEGLPPATRPDYDEACAGIAPDVPVYIVAGLVLARCQGRADVFAPDTGAGAVRDSGGRMIGTTRLIRADPKPPASEPGRETLTCSRCGEQFTDSPAGWTRIEAGIPCPGCDNGYLVDPTLSESDARPCTCGSGLPWTRCSDGGGYCG